LAVQYQYQYALILILNIEYLTADLGHCLISFRTTSKKAAQTSAVSGTRRDTSGAPRKSGCWHGMGGNGRRPAELQVNYILKPSF